jgi:hypothetical protein
VTVLHILFPIMVVVPVAVNALAMKVDPKHGDAFGLSLMVLSIWATQMTLSAFLPIPDRSGMNGMFDLMAGLIILGLWIRTGDQWLLWLLSLFVAQIYLAATFWWGWEVFSPGMTYGAYVRLNNVLWLLQLVTITAGGGACVVRRLIDDVRHRPDSRRALGA